MHKARSCLFRVGLTQDSEGLGHQGEPQGSVTIRVRLMRFLTRT